MNVIKINIKISLVLITMMLLISLESVRAQGNLILNGTFDTDLSGWTIVNDVEWYSYPPGGEWATIYGSGNPSSLSSISQTIYNLDVGTTYIVSGDYLSILSPTGYSLGVSVDDGVPQFYYGGNEGGSQVPWQNFSFSFTASSPTVTLKFTAFDYSVKDWVAIDNISMFAVPEPNTLCLLGMGATSALFFLRRRRQNL